MHKLIKFMLWIVFFESVGFLLGLVTQSNIPIWYSHLHKSSLTPPGIIFSVVWIILYALLASIAWILSEQHRVSSKKIIILFALQMLMNWAWTLLFFGLHWLVPSAIWLVGLVGLNTILIIEAKKMHKAIAWLLTPYLLWLVFAAYLNIVITLAN